MRCTFSLCQSTNTRLVERSCRIIFDATKETYDIANCYIEERWLCKSCGNPFTPSVAKVRPWHLRFGKFGKPRIQKIAKSEIIQEFFNLPK